MKFINKIFLYCLFSLICIFTFNSDVFAYNEGIYCEYKEGNNTYSFSLFADSKEDRNWDIESNLPDGIDAVGILQPYTVKTIQNKDTLNYFKSIGLISASGDFTCPTNPFNTSIGKAVSSECGTSGCHIADFASENESYSCVYNKSNSTEKIIIEYSGVTDDAIWNVTYPDGVKQQFINGQVNGNFMPGKNCEDIYYVSSTRQIKVAIPTNDGNNQTFNSLCGNYNQSDISHFCSGSCSYQDINCPVNNKANCPKILLPVFKLARRIITPIIEIAVPILLILMGTIDLSKAVLSSDDKAIKEAANKFMRRCIAAVAVFFVVTIVTVIMNMLAKVDGIGRQNGWKNCWNAAGKKE